VVSPLPTSGCATGGATLCYPIRKTQTPTRGKGMNRNKKEKRTKMPCRLTRQQRIRLIMTEKTIYQLHSPSVFPGPVSLYHQPEIPKHFFSANTLLPTDRIIMARPWRRGDFRQGFDRRGWIPSRESRAEMTAVQLPPLDSLLATTSKSGGVMSE
jgi:hypothetical protein